jgi:hypothetical protein
MGRGNLNDFLKPGQILPPNAVMIEKALEVLEHSPHGQQLVNFVQKKGIDIQIVSTPQPVTYLPEKDIIYVGFNRNNPVSPSYFILMLAGILREAQQEAAGIKHPRLHAPLSEHLEVSMNKQEDKVWYICAIATELNDQPSFTEYKFLDELKKMGHNEALELFIKQERKT